MRQSIDYTPSSIHIMDQQGSALVRFVAYKNYDLESEDLFILQNFISPDWLVHILNVESCDTAQFYFERYDERSLFDENNDLTGLSIGEMESPIYTPSNLASFEVIRSTSTHRFSLETISDAPSRSLLRYVLPLMQDGRVTKVLITSRYQTIEGIDLSINNILQEDNEFDFMI